MAWRSRPTARALVTAGYDATLRIWPLAGARRADGRDVADAAQHAWRSRPTARSSPPAPTARSTSCRGAGEFGGEIEAGPTPIIAVAVSADGKLVAAAGIRGSVAIIDRAARMLERTLVGPGLPVWSVAFFPDNRTLLTGGTDRMIRRWDAVTGEPIGDVVDGRAGRSARGLCRRSRRRGVPCLRRLSHPATADEGNRAGPTLAGIFGRRIATPARL